MGGGPVVPGQRSAAGADCTDCRRELRSPAGIEAAAFQCKTCPREANCRATCSDTAEEVNARTIAETRARSDRAVRSPWTYAAKLVGIPTNAGRDRKASQAVSR